MKRIVSLVIAVSMVLSMFATVFAASSYSDLGGENAKYAAAVAALSELSVNDQAVINGYPDGTFGPEKTVTRAELAKMLVVCLGLGSEVDALKTKTVFSDVEANNWASGWVNAAAQSKVIVGYPDGTFGADRTVTYAEAFTMALRALGYGNVADFEGTWPTAYMLKAVELNLTDDMDGVKADVPATRGNIAILLWNMLRTPMWRVTSESENSGMTLSNENNERMLNVKFPDYTYVEDVYILGVDVEDNEDVLVYLYDIVYDEHNNLIPGEPFAAQVRNIDISRLVEGEKVTALVKQGKKGEDDVFLTLTPVSEMVEGIVTKVTVNDDHEIERVEVNGAEYKFDSNDLPDEGDILFNDYIVMEVTGKKVNFERYMAGSVYKLIDYSRVDEVENLKTTFRTVKEDSLVIKNGEWTDRESIELGDIITTLTDDANDTDYFMVSDEVIEGTLDAYSVKSVKGDVSHYITVDDEEYRSAHRDNLEAYEGAENDKAVPLDQIYNVKAKDNKYLGSDVEMPLDFLGNPVRLYFGEIDDLNNGGSFYAVVNGYWEVAGKGGTTKNISLVGFDGEGADAEECSEGVDYEIKRNRDVTPDLAADVVMGAGEAAFVWANFESDEETIKTILPLYAGMADGMGDPGYEYKSKYTIIDISGLVIDDKKIEVAPDLTIKVSDTVPNMTVTPLEDEDGLIEGFAVEVKEGIKNKTEFPVGSFLAFDDSKAVKRAAYLFVANEAESTELFFGLIDEYDESLQNGIGYITINGEEYELDEDFAHAALFEGFAAIYQENKGIVKVLATIDPTTLDDGNMDAIISKDTEADTMVFTNGDSLDLEEDSDAVEFYEDYKVIELALNTTDDAGTIEFTSVEEVGEGLTSVSNKKGIRLVFVNPDKVILVYTGVKEVEQEIIDSGTIVAP